MALNLCGDPYPLSHLTPFHMEADWKCTKPAGHEGDHVAAVGPYGPGAAVLAAWPQGDFMTAVARLHVVVEDPAQLVAEARRHAEKSHVRADFELSLLLGLMAAKLTRVAERIAADDDAHYEALSKKHFPEHH